MNNFHGNYRRILPTVLALGALGGFSDLPKFHETLERPKCRGRIWTKYDTIAKRKRVEARHAHKKAARKHKRKMRKLGIHCN